VFLPAPLISTQRTHNRHPAMSGPARTSIELYRDLLRLISHLAPGTSPKSIALRTMIRSEFNKSRLLSPDSPADAVKIEALKANAVRALSNYIHCIITSITAWKCTSSMKRQRCHDGCNEIRPSREFVFLTHC
jgi:hypothetical protein